MDWHAGSHVLPQYPPGMSIILAGVSLLSWKAAFATGLLFLLATFAIVAAILRRVGVSPLLALLYLFYPTLVVYSRTVMTDLPSGTLIAAAFLALLYRRPALAGFLAGASLLLRTPNAAAVALLAAGALADSWAERRDVRRALSVAALVVAGSLPWVAASAWYQFVVQQGAVTKGYVGSNLALSHIAGTLPRYVISLGLLLPAMLLTPPFFRRQGRFALLALTYGYVLMYSLSYYTDFASTPLETLVVSQRYVQAVVPLFLVAYATALSALMAKRGGTGAFARAVVPAGVVLLALGAVGIHARHQRYLHTLTAVRDRVLAAAAPGDVLFCNLNVGKLMHPAFGKRNFTLVGSVFGEPRWHVAKAEQSIDAALAHRSAEGADGRRVVVALHVRPYRPETVIEESILADLRERYELDEVAGPDRPDTPPGLTLFFVRGKRPGAEPLPPVGDPTAPPPPVVSSSQ
jgi:hypothetical protein